MVHLKLLNYYITFFLNCQAFFYLSEIFFGMQTYGNKKTPAIADVLLAPPARLERATTRLTAECSTD